VATDSKSNSSFDENAGTNIAETAKNLNPDSKLKYKAFLMNVAKAWATD
jgi:hypothetical protein